MSISVIIADSYFVVREGYKSIITQNKNLKFLGSANCSEELLPLVKKNKPDVLIIDYENETFSLEDIKSVITLSPNTSILAVTQQPTKQSILSALQNGVKSYLLKECDKQEVLDAIQTTASGKEFFCGKIMDILSGNIAIDPDTACQPVSLSEREMGIVKLIAEGLKNQQIAEKLFLSTHTVQTHRKNIMRKLAVRNTAGIVLYAVKENLLKADTF